MPKPRSSRTPRARPTLPREALAVLREPKGERLNVTFDRDQWEGLQWLQELTQAETGAAPPLTTVVRMAVSYFIAHMKRQERLTTGGSDSEPDSEPTDDPLTAAVRAGIEGAGDQVRPEAEPGQPAPRSRRGRRTGPTEGGAA